ncbi:MAG: U32 family peptidase [Proteobacteria bacterium]|nr:MAG: U32 family peptidase [Pseudomonadota bacterium]
MIVENPASGTGRTRLSLGPILYYWPRAKILDFYAAMAESAVDTVYLGETVCAKRRALGFDDWLEVGAALAAAGKEVVLSTLSLIEAGSELGAARRVCENGQFMVEANDMSAVRMLCDRGLPFVTGPSINIYNPRTLSVLAACGLKRWVLPVELSGDALAAMQRDRPPGVETEVFGFGRLPLAWSARCYTARAHDLPKDACEFRCIDYPDGMELATQEGQPLFAFNGIQTQSAQTCDLAPHVDVLVRLGVDRIRISPQSGHTGDVVDAFRAALDGDPEPARRLRRVMPVGPCDGYWRGEPGMLDTSRCEP